MRPHAWHGDRPACVDATRDEMLVIFLPSALICAQQLDNDARTRQSCVVWALGVAAPRRALARRRPAPQRQVSSRDDVACQRSTGARRRAEKRLTTRALGWGS